MKWVKTSTLERDYNMKNEAFLISRRIEEIFLKVFQKKDLSNKEKEFYHLLIGTICCNEILTMKTKDEIIYNGRSQEDVQ